MTSVGSGIRGGYFVESLQEKQLSLTTLRMRIHFYMPENCLPPLEERAGWLSGEPSHLMQSGKAACVQCWIYLTFLRLSNEGFEVNICHQIPEEGVVVALTGNLLPNFRPSEGVFLVGVVADGTPHPACHFHILQNGIHARRLPNSAYIPLWPQPGLVPRDPYRTNTFENIYFYGDHPNLAPELRDPSFARLLKNRLGMDLVIAGSDCWHDYSQADCVLAVRTFRHARFLRKPATKLYNSWIAGVPFIGGGDSAFYADGRPGIDYLKCTSVDDVVCALEQLKNNLDFRCRMVEEGMISSRRFTPGAIAEKWKNLLHSTVSTKAPSYLLKPKIIRKIESWNQRITVAYDRLKGGY